MSIWADCQEHNAVPFFGFPVKPSFKNGLIIWEFPLGYAPNGSQTQVVAEKLREFTGGDIVEVTDKVVKVLPNEKYLGVVIFTAFLQSKKKL
jgi:hypothetical protein